MTRQEAEYLDAEVELLQKCKEKDVCDICDGKEWCINKFSQGARNEYVRRGLGCICGVDCRKYCKRAKECIGEQ